MTGAGTVDCSDYTWTLFGLGFSHHDSWVPRGSIQRASILRDLETQNLLDFFMTQSEGTQSGIHGTLFAEAIPI